MGGFVGIVGEAELSTCDSFKFYYTILDKNEIAAFRVYCTDG